MKTMHPLQTLTFESAEIVTRALAAYLEGPFWATGLESDSDEEQKVRELLERVERVK